MEVPLHGLPGQRVEEYQKYFSALYRQIATRSIALEGNKLIYPAPASSDYINNLPLLTEPSVFGIHKNRQRDKDIEVVRELFRKLDRTSPNEDNVDSLCQQEQILNVVANILSKIPDKFQCEKQQASLGSNAKPTTICLIRELNTFNSLISLMQTSMDDVRKAITGLCVTIEPTNETRMSLLNHSPPRIWMQFSPDSNLSIGNWLSNFEKRYDQFAKWVSRGEPWLLWLSGLAYPEAFITAVSQVACREAGWSIDSVALNTYVTGYEKRSEIPSKPKTGFYVEGLYLDGASWDRVNRCLTTTSKKNNLHPLPIVSLFPTPTVMLSTQGINLPMYTTKRRRENIDDKVIAELCIPTKKHESYWILENVSVVMSTD